MTNEELVRENESLRSRLAAAEEQLRTRPASERRFQALIEKAVGAVCVIDAHGTIIYASPNSQDVIGVPPADMIGQDGFQQLDVDDIQRNLQLFSEVLATPGAVRFSELRVCHRDGSRRWLQITATNLLQDPDVAGVVINYLDITERKRAMQNEERFAALLNHNPSLLFLKDEEGKYVYLNSAYEKQFVRRSDWLDKTDYDFWPKQSADLFRANDLQAIQSGQFCQFLEDALDRDGIRHCWLCYKFPFTDSQGRRYVGGIGIDSTARVHAEEALRASEERFRDIAQASADWIWEIDAQGRYTYASEGLHATLGYYPRELLGRTPFDLMPPAEAQRARREFEAIARRREAFRDLPNDNLHKDGTLRHIVTSGVPILDAQGAFRGYRGVDRDITRQRHAEETLHANEELLRAVMENSPDAIYVKDRQSRWLMANPAVLRLVKKNATQALGQTDVSLYGDPAIGRAILENDQRVMDQGNIETFEEIADTPDGRRTFLSVKAPRRDAQGLIIGLVGISRDITERKRTEITLRQSEERHRALANTMMHGVVHQRADGTIIAMNPAAEYILGKTRVEFLGSSSVQEEHDTVREDGSLFSGMDHPAMVALRTGLPVRGVIMGVWNPRRHERRWIEIDAVPLCLTGQTQPTEVYAIFADITDRKHAQEALRQANAQLEARVAARTRELAAANSKLQAQIDAYHRLEAEVARLVESERLHIGMELHDNVCQQLAAIGMRLSILLHKSADPHVSHAAELEQLLGYLRHATEDTHRLSRGLLPVDVKAEGLVVALEALTHQMDHAVKCEFFCPKPVVVPSNTVATHLYRIAQESVRNALKHAQARRIVVSLLQTEGILLMIADDGIGIPPENKRKKGAGLGLLDYRARLIGATLSVISGTTGGTIVQCVLTNVH